MLSRKLLYLLQIAAVIAAVELPVYDFCKLHLLETFGDHVANHFMLVNDIIIIPLHRMLRIKFLVIVTVSIFDFQIQFHS